MAKRLKTRPIPLEIVVEAADHANFDAGPFGMLTAFSYAYWRNPFDTSAMSRDRLAFLCRCSANQLRPYEVKIRAAIPALSARLDQAKAELNNRLLGIATMLDAATARRRAQSAELRRAKADAPLRTTPVKTWGARRAAIEGRAAGVVGFVD